MKCPIAQCKNQLEGEEGKLTIKQARSVRRHLENEHFQSTPYAYLCPICPEPTYFKKFFLYGNHYRTHQIKLPLTFIPDEDSLGYVGEDKEPAISDFDELKFQPDESFAKSMLDLEKAFKHEPIDSPELEPVRMETKTSPPLELKSNDFVIAPSGSPTPPELESNNSVIPSSGAPTEMEPNNTGITLFGTLQPPELELNNSVISSSGNSNFQISPPIQNRSVIVSPQTETTASSGNLTIDLEKKSPESKRTKLTTDSETSYPSDVEMISPTPFTISPPQGNASQANFRGPHLSQVNLKRLIARRFWASPQNYIGTPTSHHSGVSFPSVGLQHHSSGISFPSQGSSTHGVSSPPQGNGSGISFPSQGNSTHGVSSPPQGNGSGISFPSQGNSTPGVSSPLQGNVSQNSGISFSSQGNNSVTSPSESSHFIPPHTSHNSGFSFPIQGNATDVPIQPNLGFPITPPNNYNTMRKRFMMATGAYKMNSIVLSRIAKVLSGNCTKLQIFDCQTPMINKITMLPFNIICPIGEHQQAFDLSLNSFQDHLETGHQIQPFNRRYEILNDTLAARALDRAIGCLQVNFIRNLWNISDPVEFYILLAVERGEILCPVNSCQLRYQMNTLLVHMMYAHNFDRRAAMLELCLSNRAEIGKAFRLFNCPVPRGIDSGNLLCPKNNLEIKVSQLPAHLDKYHPSLKHKMIGEFNTLIKQLVFSLERFVV